MDACKTLAIILRRVPKNEFHAEVTVFTKVFGKMTLTAMGLYKISSKLSPMVLSGNLVYLTLSKGRQWHITGAKVAEPFSVGLFEPRVYYLSCIVREALAALFPIEEPHEDIFNIATECFRRLASPTHSIKAKELVVYRFLLAAFSAQGLLPAFSICSKEGKPLGSSEKRFWKAGRGIVCNTCNIAVSGTTLELPSTLNDVGSYTTADALSGAERNAITVMLQDIFTETYNKPLVSLTIWDESIKKPSLVKESLAMS